MLALVGVGVSIHASDWPSCRHDERRSGVTDEKLSFPMRPAWVYTCAQPPRIAWPEPVKNLNRLDFDYAPQPVIANGIVCFGSSADDTIRALDLKTGAEKWHFITGGPVRFAPQIANGKVYAAADDGFVYCLDAATGNLVWKFRAALEDDRLIGNDRMISRRPCRTGVLVAEGVVYCTAGMWSSEGVYVYALDAATGKIQWCNDTSGIVSEVRVLHMGHDYGTYGVCPQGTLAAQGNILLVPTGKGLPAGYDRKTGKLLYYKLDPADNTVGGSSIIIEGNRFFVNSANPSSLASFDLATGKRLGGCGDRELDKLSSRALGRAYSVYKGKISAIFLPGGPYFRQAGVLACAGDVILSGEEAAVVALDAKTKGELWRAPVKGTARGLAVADGCLVATTDRGEVTCFVAGAEKTESGSQKLGVGSLEVEARRQKAEGGSRESGVGSQNTDKSEIRNPKSEIISHLQAAGMDRGYALVLGDADGQMSLLLASQTPLHVVNVLPDAAAALLREKLLATTALYGSRIEVQTVEKFDHLPLPQYFANAIVVANPVPGLSGKELYRALRPCGGVLLLPGLSRTEADTLVKESGAMAEEVGTSGGLPAMVRESLPGARDWDTGNTADQRVKWPLRLLWFGGPGPSMVMDRKMGNVIGPVANGRYFVLGEDLLTAVDAYNGCILWSRRIPMHSRLLRYADEKTAIAGSGEMPQGRGLSVDAENVYLTLGGCFRGGPEEKNIIQIDARTGEQKKIQGAYAPPPNIPLTTAQTWPLPIDPAHSGSVTLQATPNGLTLNLTTKDPSIAPLDHWDLFFDFRPFDQRYGLYGRGTFHAQIFPAKDAKTTASWKPGTGPMHPSLEVSGTREPDTTTTTVQLSWAEVKKLTGAQPSSFGFAVTLNSHDGRENEDVVQKHVFSDIMAEGLNNGWANVQLSGTADPDGKPPALVGNLPALPQRQKRTVKKRGGATAGGSSRLAARIHPLTGEREAKFFQVGSMGCGTQAWSEDCVIARSTAISIYDFADDSGTRNFDGVKPSCTGSVTAALGLLLSSEGRGGCVCTTDFQTSLALAPVEKRSNEDWALYYDLDVDTLVRQAAINLGAPGDRRDESGTLWLGFPRVLGGLGQPAVPEGAHATGFLLRGSHDGRTSSSLRVPFEIETQPDMGPYRVSADRIAIAGTKQPWIYTSNYRGIKKATLKLGSEKQISSKPATAAPIVDGQLAEAVWSGEPQAVLSATKTDVFFRHDTENLYLASRQAPLIDPKGKTTPWAKGVLNEKGEFFRGITWEVFISDTASQKVIHLGLSPGGSRFDALQDLVKGKTEDLAWTAPWKSAASADDKAFVTEIAIPWKTLAAAGLDKDHVQLNFQMNTGFRQGGAFRYLGPGGREACQNFIPLGLGTPLSAVKSRLFTVRLHFAELDDVKPGQRVFDVKLQDQVVLKDFDVVKEAGGARTALVKEFKNIRASEALTVEFLVTGKELTAGSAPILSAIEVYDEDFRTAAKLLQPQ